MTTEAQSEGMEKRARELLAEAWGDHPQWQEVRERILDGSCKIHSDPLSLSCTIALRAIIAALSQAQCPVSEDEVEVQKLATYYQSKLAERYRQERDEARAAIAALQSAAQHKGDSNG